MQGFKISFKALPFTPEENQVIFVESGYDERTNAFIRENYLHIREMFLRYDYQFVYLPLIYKDDFFCEQLHYYAPYLKLDATEKEGLPSSTILKYMVERENKIGPSLIFNAQKEGEQWCFDGLLLEKEDLNRRVMNAGFDICFGTPSVKLADDSEVRFRISEDVISKCIVCENSAHYDDEDIDPLVEELSEKIKALRLKGITLVAIHELIDKMEPLSRMVITNDFRIFLPEYGNLEIEMGALPKALFFLFLRYPEGIAISYLQDHAIELLNIYRQLRHGTAESRMRETISKLVDPLDNSINENFARIRRAFVTKFDDHLARNYYIHGKAGESYGIPLDRELVTWED